MSFAQYCHNIIMSVLYIFIYKVINLYRHDVINKYYNTQSVGDRLISKYRDKNSLVIQL